jgi:DNA repair photolyase
MDIAAYRPEEHNPTAWLDSFEDETDQTKENYAYFMRPEPRENLGPIIEVRDHLTGRVLRSRQVAIGMVRNATERKEVTAYLDPFPHIRIDKAKDLQGWYKGKDEDDAVRPRPCYTDALLTEPYGGYCAVGCAFCYINSGFRGYRGTGLITVPVHYGQQVRLQLAKLKTSAAGYFSSFTDPFTPLEELYHNTQEAAQAFDDNGLPVFFLSRLRYPDWAVELLQRNKYSYAQKSLNTNDVDDWRLLSPGALPLEDHLADIQRLRAAGIYVSIQCNPIIPGVTSHEQVEHLFELLAEAGANHVIVKFVEAGYSWAPAMVERIKRRFGDERGSAFERLFTENMGGQRTIAEWYRLEGHRRYSSKAAQLGLTYATCYEYKYERSPSGAISGKTGVSLARDYLTADQCHGQRVPMFSRESLSEPFREVEECPPSGCLYCADDNGGQPRCGSELYGSAKALRLVDLKKSIWD